MSATTDKPAKSTIKAPTAAQRRRIAKAKGEVVIPLDAPADAPALALVPDAPADAPVADAPVEEHPAVASFKAGQSIAAIARSLKIGQAKVREALDAASVDYSADKNARPVGATTKATKTPAAPKGERTLLASYQAILAKTVDASSKRGKVVADLASDANAADLQTIVASLATADRKALAAGANALNAALSAHYARLS